MACGYCADNRDPHQKHGSAIVHLTAALAGARKQRDAHLECKPGPHQADPKSCQVHIISIEQKTSEAAFDARGQSYPGRCNNAFSGISAIYAKQNDAVP
jgi:hypothetical protein